MNVVNKVRIDISEDLLWIVRIFEDNKVNKYYGKIEVNFFSGGITSIHKGETIKPPQLNSAEVN